MPLRRLFNTIARMSPRHSEQDVVMMDTASSVVTPPSSSPSLGSSRTATGPTSLGKRRYEQSSEAAEAAYRIATRSSSSSMTADASFGGVTSPLDSPADISATLPPLKRRNLALDPIDTAPSNIPGPSSRSAEPVSPAPTEIALDLGDVEQTHEERLESLQAAGIKVRDFAYEPMPNSSKAPEVFDPLPSLIAADWHMRNPDKNLGLLTPKNLFRLLKVGWLSLEDVRRMFNPFEYTALAQYNLRPAARRYPFVVSRKGNIPTPSERVRLRRRAGLRTHPDDRPDSVFFGYDPTGESDDEGLPCPPPRAPARAAPVAEALERSTSMVEGTAATATAGAAEQPKAKRRRVKGATKARGRAKSLRRECSRPEV